MRAIGLIAEYNPFHLGHLYQLETIKSIYPDAIIIVLMSGNSVQRGEFAFIDKWTRAAVATKSGADLVLEAPVFQTLQAADYFAYHSVEILNRIGVDRFVFGTETATTQQMIELAEALVRHQPDIDSKLQRLISHGYSYAAAYAAAINSSLESFSLNYNLPNHMLGLQYIKASNQLQQPLAFDAIPRVKMAYQQKLQSGSDIRASVSTDEEFRQQAVPTHLYPSDLVIVHWSDYFDLLQYRLATHSPESLRDILHVREGLEHRLLKVGQSAESFEALLESLVNRRWTRSSIQRVLLAVLLNFRTQDIRKAINQFYQEPSLRILAMSQVGRKWLREYSGEVTFYSRANQAYLQSHFLEIRLDRVYQLNPTKEILDQILVPIPYIQ